MTDIVPPHSIPAEQSVLGALMQAPERLHDVADWLTSGDFYRRDHALIFQAITEQAAKGQPVDAVTLADWFEGVELADQVGGLGYLVDLSRTTPSAANLVAYAEIVVEKSRLRRLAEAGGRIAEMALEPNARASADVAAEAEALLRGVAPEARSGGLESIHGALRKSYEAFCERYEGRGVLGLPFPWLEMSEKVRLVPGETTVLAGRPSMGKSVLGFQVALETARAGKRVAVFSLETQTLGVVNRMLACAGGVPLNFILRPDPEREDLMPRLTMAMRELDRLNGQLHIDDTARLSAGKIAARARRAHMRQPFDLIVVDHLHELKLPGRANKAEELGESLAELRALARDLRVPLLALAQLNRNAANENRRPTMADLKASGDIEEKADTILLLHRPDHYDRADRPGLIQVEVAKCRDGERGVDVNLRNDFAHMRALDWDGDVPMRQVITTPKRWGKGTGVAA